MHVEPRDEHRWLHRLIGEWTYTSVCEVAPGEVVEGAGRETVRAMGDLWVIAEMAGEIPGGGAFTANMQLGFDTRTGRFVGSWIGSPMAHMFVYDGELDAGRGELRLFCEGPSFEDPAQIVPYCDVITLTSDGTRLLTPRVRRDDGTWHEFMRSTYTRVG